MNNKKGVIFTHIQRRDDTATEEGQSRQRRRGTPKADHRQSRGRGTGRHPPREGTEKTAEALQTKGGEGVETEENHKINPLSDYQGRDTAGNTRRTHHKPQI